MAGEGEGEGEGEAAAEFDCKEFLLTEPGAGLNGIIEGFTAGLDNMLKPFEIAYTVMDKAASIPPWLVSNAGIAVPAMAKVAAMPVILGPDVALKIVEAPLPPLPILGLNMPGGPNAPDFGVDLATELGASIGGLLAGLIQLPLDMLIGAVGGLDVGKFSPAAIPELIAPMFPPGPPLPDGSFGINPIAENLTSCIVAAMEAKFPLAEYDPGADENKPAGLAAEKKNKEEYQLGFKDGKKGIDPFLPGGNLPRPIMKNAAGEEEEEPVSFHDEQIEVEDADGNITKKIVKMPDLDTEGNPIMKPAHFPPDYYKDGYYHGWQNANPLPLVPIPPSLGDELENWKTNNPVGDAAGDWEMNPEVPGGGHDPLKGDFSE